MRQIVAWLEARPFWTVSILSLLLLLSGNWILPLIDRDEPRFAEASREMTQRDDFVVPRFNGDYRFDKPPLIYWCQAASFAVLGENEFAARLPSAAFAWATALLLLGWGRRLGENRAGFHAAVMFTACLQVLIHGRLAVADMPMVFFFTAAVWSGWEMTRPEFPPWRGWWWMFFISLALGFLAKGPEAWLPLAGLGLARWRRPELFRLDLSVVAPGVAVAVGLTALWGVPAVMRTNGEFFTVGIGRHVIHRSFGVMEGHGMGGWLGWLALMPFYAVTFFASFLPWSVRVPGALRRRREARGNEVLDWFLLTQVGIVFVVFTVVKTKLPHYTLPAFPCLALWLARQTSGAEDSGARLGRGVTWMAGVTVIAVILFCVARPRLLAANVWREIQPYARPEMRAAVAGFGEPSLVWELRRVMTNRIETVSAAQGAEFLRGPAPRCLIVPTEDWQAAHLQAPAGAVTLRADGWDTANLKHWDVTAVLVGGGHH